MSQSSAKQQPAFVVATPQRSVCDHNARALEKRGALRLLALGTRRGTSGVARERTRLLPACGLANFIAVKLLPPFAAESFRFRLHPWFDRWVLKQLQPGDCLISSYGYANASFQYARQHGGKTFLDGGNSHPAQFWEILTEEHARWKCPTPPIARHHHERSLAMMEHVDYVLSPSRYVSESFLTRGFSPAQILRNVYPVDLSLFRPATTPRPKNRPLTLVNTGSLSLRKGTPYLLEAFKLIRQRHPSARLLLTRIIQDDVKAVLAKYRDLPIEWVPPMPHPELAQHLQQADLFVLPSLEEGMARTAAEALACGLPAILTPNTGANDLIQSGKNGEVVPIRDAHAIAEAVLKWAEILRERDSITTTQIDPTTLSVERFEREFLEQLERLGLIATEANGSTVIG